MSSKDDAVNKFLIKFVEPYDELYNKQNKNYSNKEKEGRWELISQKLQTEGFECSALNCKERWNAVRARYIKERAKIRTTPSGSAAKDSTPTWPLFNDLAFLEPYIISKKRLCTSNVLNQSTTLENGVDELDDPDENILDDETGTFILTKNVKLAPGVNANSKIDTEDTYLKDIMVNLSSVIQKTSDTNTKDEDAKRFCESLYHEICKVPDNVRLRMKMDVLSAISKYQSNSG